HSIAGRSSTRPGPGGLCAYPWLSWRLPSCGGALLPPPYETYIFTVQYISDPLTYALDMVRPGSWIRLAGESPVPVGTGVPGSRPRFVGEIRRAKRGVKSLFGGSK